MKDFLSSTIKNLINNEYSFIGLSDGTDKVSEDTAFGVCIKAVPPVLYVVSIVNTERITPEQFEEHSAKFLTKLRANKARMNCSFTVDVNILAGKSIDTNVIDLIDSKDYDPTSRDHSIWWAADTTAKMVLSGKNMPDNIGDIRQTVEKAFGKSADSTITDMERAVLKEAEGRRVTKKHTVTYMLIGITVLAFIFMRLFGGEQLWAYKLGNDHTRIVLYGEYFRLITCMFVHAGFMHIGYNCISLFIFGTRAEEYLGHLGFLLLYFGAGLCGSILSFMFTDGLSVGASGAVYGAAGAVFALSAVYKKSIGGLSYMAMLLFVIAGLGIGAMGGNVDNFAHIGGLAFGFLCTYIILKISKRENG